MSETYTPLHVHIFSLLDSISCVDKFVERAKEIGSTSLALTDHGTMAGAIKFHTECNKQGIKPILGLEAYICDKPATQKDEKNRSLMHLILLAKNLEGWYDLVKINNISNKGEHFYYNPRAHFDDIKEITKKGNLIGMSACIGGIIATKLFDNYKDAYREKTYEAVQSCLKKDWLKVGIAETKKWHDAFDGNFYLEVQNEGMASQTVVRDCLRKVSQSTGIKVVATTDSHFPEKLDAVEHEILISSQTGMSLAKRQEKRTAGQDLLFFDNSQYFIKSHKEMVETGFTEEEIANTNFVADQVEEFELKAKNPRLPVFPLPDGVTDKEKFFVDLCKKGLKRIGKENDKEYKDRANMEFSIFKSVKTEKASLLDYFLIIWGIIEEIKRIDSITPVGRGSAAGCLCSYLLDITKVDPIKYELSFQRFFNTGRLSEGRVSLPDIDLDCGHLHRKELIVYLKEKYGEENVTLLVTYGTLAPKAALKEVLKAYSVPFDEANHFTKQFPEEELKQDEDFKYTIEDALKISPEFKELAENYKAQVASAIKLQGCKKSRGIHPAAVIINDEPLSNIIPLAWDTKSKSLVCAFEMNDAEFVGLTKFDLLGLKLITVFQLCTEKINDKKIKATKLKVDDEGYRDVKSEQVILNYFRDGGFSHKQNGTWHEFKKVGKVLPIFIVSGKIKDFMKKRMDNNIYIFHQENEDGRVIIVDGANVYTTLASQLALLKMDSIVRFGVIQKEKLIKTLKV